MKTIRLISSLAIVAAVVVLAAITAPGATAEEDVPLSDAKCTFKLKKRYPLEQVLRDGLKVKVTCDGPASVDVMVAFQGKQRRDWIDLHPGGVPGISRGKSAELEQAGTVTLRSELIPKKFMRRYAKSTLEVFYGKERLDRPGVFRSVGGKDIVLVR